MNTHFNTLTCLILSSMVSIVAGLIFINQNKSRLTTATVNTILFTSSLSIGPACSVAQTISEESLNQYTGEEEIFFVNCGGLF